MSARSLATAVRSTVLAAAGLSALFVPVAASAADLSCELRTVKRGNSSVLEAVIGSNGAAQGSYRITISSSGGADIDQSGEFNLRAGQRQTVGSATVGTPGNFTAKLSARAGGSQCTANASGRNS